MRSATLWGLGCLMLALVAVGEVCAAEGDPQGGVMPWGPQPGLVGWWNFDEGPGPAVADATGNGNAGTLTGGVQWVAQETGGALELDGSSGYIRISFSESLRVLNKGGLTITAWFRADAIPAENKEVFQQGDANGTGRTWLYISATTGQIQTYLGGAATPSGVNVTAETWFHAAVVITEAGATDTIQIYVNGKPAGAAAQRGMEDSEGPYFIGCHKNLTNFWDGIIDDVRLYNRALSAAEIQAMVPPKVKAMNPDPTSGSTAVVTPLLRWTAGETAVLHNIYVGTDPNLGDKDLVQARAPVAMYFHVPGLTPGTTYYWRVDEIEVDMTTVHTGDVWTFIAQALTAYLPVPADGANDASPDPNMTLAWLAGMSATGHHVYFGDDREAVRTAAPVVDKGMATGTTFAPGPLEPLATYYWRVDEIGVANAVNQGPVWTFTTCLSVDDFESYNDDVNAKTTIFDTWIDGWTNNTGSTVGYVQAPFAERKIVHGGKQSMPLDYNNVNSPWYSEAERQWATPQNWTAEGADRLHLFVRGNATNGLGALYVAVEDSSGKVAVAVNPNPNIVRVGVWTQWDIPLSSLTGVDLSRVKTLYVGVGDRNTPAAGGRGRLYIDDIRVTKP
jgi:hypothetical protein